MGKNWKRIYIYIYMNHFAVHLKLTQHCKSSLLQFLKVHYRWILLLMLLLQMEVGKEYACNAGDPVRSLGPEDPMEKDMATHSSTFAWEIPWTEKPGRPQSMGSQELDMTEQLNHHHHHCYLLFIFKRENHNFLL